MPLPTTTTPPTLDPALIGQCLYGPPAGGKTTTLAQAEGVRFLSTEPGGCSHLDVMAVDCSKDWGQFGAALRDLKSKDAERFKTVVVDTFDSLVALCDAHHQGGKPGEGNRALRTVIQQLHALAFGRFGVVWLCHEQTKDYHDPTFSQLVGFREQPRGGRAYQRTEPKDYHKNPCQLMVQLCSVVARIAIDKNGQRGIECPPPGGPVLAKQRLARGKLPAVQPLSWAGYVQSFRDAYAAEAAGG